MGNKQSSEPEQPAVEDEEEQGKMAANQPAAEQPAAVEAQQMTPIHASEAIAFKRDGSVEFSMENKGQKQLLYKIKSNDFGAIEVQPQTMGVLQPTDHLHLEVKLRREVVGQLPKKELKLLVQVAEVSERIDDGRIAEKTTEQLRAIWKEIEKAKSFVHNTKITISTEAVQTEAVQNRLNEERAAGRGDGGNRNGQQPKQEEEEENEGEDE